MAITPDTKDWTWVLERPCPQCGFDASSMHNGAVADLLRANIRVWPAVLERSDVRRRPDPAVWSPLEYAAHVRDVFRLFRTRLHLMLQQDDPTYPDWDQDEAAIAGRYSELDPSAVSTELVEAGTELADDLDAVEGTTWERVGRRGDGVQFTVASFSRYLLHDVTHHAWDVR